MYTCISSIRVPFRCVWTPSWHDRNPSSWRAPDNKRRSWWRSSGFVRAIDWPHCNHNRRALCRTCTVCSSRLPVWNATCRPCCACPSYSTSDCTRSWTCRRADCQRHCKDGSPESSRDRPKNSPGRGKLVCRSAGHAKGQEERIALRESDVEEQRELPRGKIAAVDRKDYVDERKGDKGMQRFIWLPTSGRILLSHALTTGA